MTYLGHTCDAASRPLLTTPHHRPIRTINTSWRAPLLQAPLLQRSNAAGAPDAATAASTATVDKILAATQHSTIVTVPEEVTDHIKSLMAGPNPTPSPATVALQQGQGVWEVFHAPHMRFGASLLRSSIAVQYLLESEGSLVTHVRFENALASGWLSSSGRIQAAGEDGLALEFDRFWVDFGGKDALRPTLPEELSLVDKAIGAAGRLAFLAESAVFPIRYLDDRVAIFNFPLLDVDISIKKITA